MMMRPLEAVSNWLRSIIVAAPGHELIAADFNAIEARVLAWLAGESAVLGALADPARDVYVEAARTVGSQDRWLGKLCALALGYSMGAIKFATTAASQGIVLPLKEARRITFAWREANQNIVSLWSKLEDACRAAIASRGVVIPVGEFLRVAANKECLQIRLPSGRVIRYWRPSVRTVTKKIQTVDEDGEIVEVERETEEIRFWTSGANAVDMMPESTYGGKLVENVTQGISRDLLGEALLRLESAGYPVVVHVHDSIVSEVTMGSGSVEQFCSIMETRPSWAADLPLKCEGYRGVRFKG